MGHIYSFSFSNTHIQNNPRQITAFLKYASKGEISKKLPGMKKKKGVNCCNSKKDIKRLEENVGLDTI